MSENDQGTAFLAARALLLFSVAWKFDAADYAFRRDLIPHIKHISTVAMGRIERFQMKECVTFALAYYENALLDDAENLLVLVMQSGKSRLGGEHDETLDKGMTILASILSVQGRHQEAKELEDRAARLLKEPLGSSVLKKLWDRPYARIRKLGIRR